MRISSIKINKRKRNINQAKVTELAQSIAEIGLINPITVLADGTLIAGLHRLEAVKSLGLSDIDCHVVSFDDAIDAELAEIDENLMRNELSVLEQAEHIADRERLLEEKGLRADSGTNQKNATNGTGVTVTPVKTTKDLASDIGLSENSYQKRKQIAANIPEAVKDEIRNTDIANSTTQLLELARMPEVEQLQVIETVKAGEAKNVKEAKEQGGFNYKRDNKAAVSAEIDKARPFDHCQTPPYALDPLIPYLPKAAIWEPAAGEGYLVEGLYDAGFNVVQSRIEDGQNFFDYEPDDWQAQVTNPPYSVKYQWLERSYQLGKPFALLLPVETLGAQSGQNLFRQYGLEIVFLDKRVDFKMPNAGWQGGGSQFPVAWFTWGLKIGKELTFATIDKKWVVY